MLCRRSEGSWFCSVLRNGFQYDAAHHIRGNRYKTKLNMTSVVLQTIHLNYLLTKLNTLRPARETALTRHGLIGSTLLPDQKVKLKRSVVTRSICITHAAIKAGSSNYNTEIILVLIIFKSEESVNDDKWLNQWVKVKFCTYRTSVFRILKCTAICWTNMH